MPRICVITYDYLHLKTEQVLTGYHDFGMTGIDVFGLPFLPRKQREVLFQHRPDPFMANHPKDVCASLGYPYQPVTQVTDVPEGYDEYIIVGAGLLPAEFVRGKNILNCHPGLLPYARGLDSFKWSILYGVPVGCSLHYIDEEVDQGTLLASRPTLVFGNDKLETLARRQYENEINMMVNFRALIEEGKIAKFDGTESFCHMRMPRDKEEQMFEKFEPYRDCFS